MVSTRKIPKVSLFLQGGYGKPGFNFLKNKFDFYYIGGIRFNWSLAGLYTSRNDRQLFDLNKSMISAQKETFLYNTQFSLSRQEVKSRSMMISLMLIIRSSHSMRVSWRPILHNWKTERLPQMNISHTSMPLMWPGKILFCTRLSFSWHNTITRQPPGINHQISQTKWINTSSSHLQ